jgi:hypothetical protein
MFFVGDVVNLDKEGKQIGDGLPDITFHFFVQNSDGFWSHKDRNSSVTNLDFDGNVIIDPRDASRRRCKEDPAGGQKCVDYSELCGCSCVSKGGVKLR